MNEESEKLVKDNDELSEDYQKVMKEKELEKLKTEMLKKKAEKIIEMTL